MKTLCYCVLIIFCNSVLAASNELKVAVFLEPPFVDLIDNKYVGENIDIINIITDSLKVTPVYLRCPFVRCLTMIKSGQADMILGLSKSPSREKDLIFINPPYLFQQQPLRFFIRQDKKLSIEKFRDLEGLLVGTLRGAAYFPKFDNNQKIEKVELTSRDQLVSMLLKGRIDTFLEREETVLPLLSTTEYQEKMSIAHFQYNKPMNSYIALSKHTSAKDYAEKISSILAKAIDDGTIEHIRKTNKVRLANIK